MKGLCNFRRPAATLRCMKALVITSLSGPDALSVQEAAETALKSG
jgi:hypothetical protein